jgi:CPA1 family monovalent cation:H+ antiporter
VFLLNGTVFILIGMQIPFILQGMENYSPVAAIGYAAIISIASVIIRILWVYPGTYLPRLLSKKVREQEPRPDVKSVFIVAWSGMRGVVSLASALTIPVTLTNLQVFPHRNLILFITFSVILFTLVVQGITLPFLIRVLKIEGDDAENLTNVVMLNKELAQNVLKHMDDNYATEVQNNDTYKRIRSLYQRLKDESDKQAQTTAEKTTPKHSARRMRVLMLEMIKVQRKQLEEFGKNDQYTDQLIRSKENELDFEEARIRKSGL